MGYAGLIVMGIIVMMLGTIYGYGHREKGDHVLLVYTLIFIFGLYMVGVGIGGCRTYEYDAVKYKCEITNIVQATVKEHPDNSNNNHYRVVIQDSQYEMESKTKKLLMQKMNLKKEDVDVDVSDASFSVPTLKCDEYEKIKNVHYCRVVICIFLSKERYIMYVPMA